MCGIAGLIGWEKSIDEGSSILTKMSKTLVHRGPDDNGKWISEKDKVFLTHTRLSILDLSNAGKQPMISSCERYIITFNGEIYNHLDLRKLINKSNNSIQWKGNSDTETLIELISSMGLNESLKLLVGMFSFGLYDKKIERFSLVRDRFGEKPLYYSQIKKNFFTFSSEIKAIEQIPEFKKLINMKALASLFQRGWIAGPDCIWQSVNKVMPGSIINFQKNNFGNFEIRNEKKYWDIEKIAINNQKNLYKHSYSTAVKELEQKLTDVIKGQLISDVPLGVFLSGGIDSSLVTALMQKVHSKQVKSFSIGFTEKDYDESYHAEKVSTHLGTNHKTLLATPNDALDLIEDMPNIYSEPFADSSQIPTTLLCRMVKEHVTVALSGDGADELFSGYRRYIFANNNYKLINYSPLGPRKLLSSVLNKVPYEVNDFIGNLLGIQRLGNKVVKASEIMISKDISDYYNKLTSYWPSMSVVKDIDSGYIKFTKKLADVENMMLADQLFYLPNDILVKVDRASMSESLETRNPYLDHELASFAWSLPSHWRYDKNSGKKILKDILYKYVPKKIIDRPKQGFGMPVNEWLRGPLKDWSGDLISKSVLPDEGLIRGDLVRKTWEEHISGKKNWEYRLWPVLMLQQWNLSKGYF